MHLRVSKRKASAISTAMLLVLLAVNSLTNNWWPYIYITIGAPLFARQYLLGRTYDSIISLTIFGGLFLVSQFEIDWSVILPVVFIVSAVMILFREFCNPFAAKEPEIEEDHNLENMEDK